METDNEIIKILAREAINGDLATIKKYTESHEHLVFYMVPYIAINMHHNDMFVYLLDNGLNVTRDIFALILFNNNYELTKIVLENKDIKISEHKTDHLMTLSCKCSFNIVKLLIEHGFYNHNLFLSGAIIGRNDVEFLKLFIDLDLFDISHSSLSIACRNGNIEIVKLLMDHFDLSSYYKSALIESIEHSHYELVDLFINENIDLKPYVSSGIIRTSWDDYEPLMKCIDNFKMFMHLINYGADINDYPELLSIAIFNKDTTIVEYLLNNNYRITNINDCIHNICLEENIPVFELFEEYELVPTDNIKKIINDCINEMICPKMYLYLANKYNNNGSKINPNALLYSAVMKHDYELALEALKDGASIESFDELIVRDILCHNDITGLKFIMDNGYDIKKINWELKCPIEMGHNEMVKFLLENGVSINNRFYYDIVRTNNLEMMKLILSHTKEISFEDIECIIYNDDPFISEIKTEMIKLLLDRVPKVEHYMISSLVKEGNMDLVNYLLSKN